MKKIVYLFTFALLMFALVTNANALTVEQSLFVNEMNWLSDNSAFYLINANGSTIDNQTIPGTPDDSTIVVGDRIRGMFEIATVEGVTSGITRYLGGTSGNNEFTGMYELEVVSKTGSAGAWQFIMGPSTRFQTEMEVYMGLGAGSLPNVAVSMWQDLPANVNYTRLSASDDIGGAYVATPFIDSEEALIDNAQDGSDFWAFGFTNDLLASYWIINTTDDDIWNLKTGLPAGSNYGTVNLALDLVYNPLGIPVDPHVTINPGHFADLTGSGNMLTVGGVGTPMDGFDNFDLQINVVPEPATMLLLGSGLIGLAGFSRRKFNRKNKK